MISDKEPLIKGTYVDKIIKQQCDLFLGGMTVLGDEFEEVFVLFFERNVREDDEGDFEGKDTHNAVTGSEKDSGSDEQRFR